MPWQHTLRNPGEHCPSHEAGGDSGSAVDVGFGIRRPPTQLWTAGTSSSLTLDWWFFSEVGSLPSIPVALLQVTSSCHKQSVARAEPTCAGARFQSSIYPVRGKAVSCPVAVGEAGHGGQDGTHDLDGIFIGVGLPEHLRYLPHGHSLRKG